MVFQKICPQDVWPRFLQWRTLWAPHLLLCKVPWSLANGKGGGVALNFPTPNGGEFSKGIFRPTKMGATFIQVNGVYNKLPRNHGISWKKNTCGILGR